MRRRQFLQQSAIASVAFTVTSPCRGAGPNRRPRILLRSSWQAVNIGDIAHTPGVLAILEERLPDAEVQLWSSNLPTSVADMLTKRFPGLMIVNGKIGDDGKAANKELQTAIDWADFLLHGSGPFLVARNDLAQWVKYVQKPYGVYGITFGAYDEPQDTQLLSEAQFAYFRDSPSLEAARLKGVSCDVMEFAPDGAFGCDLRNDEAAATFLKAHNLEVGRFACCIPRWRLTPGWQMHNRKPNERDLERQARSMEMVEHDHAPLRETISRIVRETDLKVLVCPEDMTQMKLGKEWIVDRLPADVLKRVVWRENFWLTDEALSTYTMSAGLFGLEMHSPIMCIGNGIPATVGRFEEQSSKGLMWKDIGLEDWLFDMDIADDIKRMPDAIFTMLTDPVASQRKVARAQEIVQSRQKDTIAQLAGRLM